MSEQFGICRLAVAPIRALPADNSEMINQLLFGEHYSVTDTSEDEKWIRIRSEFDQYAGWLDLKQHHAIDGDYFYQITPSDYQICTEITTAAVVEGRSLNLLIGSVLPVSKIELFSNAGTFAFNGNAKPMSEKLNFPELKNIALKYLYAPYLWGGKTPFGTDCSGFVQQVFRISGYGLPRDSYQQANYGAKVESLGSSRAGDLAFFTSSTEKVNHVGIILEDGRIIHASGQVRIDQLTEEGIYDGRRVTHNLNAITRVLP